MNAGAQEFPRAIPCPGRRCTARAALQHSGVVTFRDWTFGPNRATLSASGNAPGQSRSHVARPTERSSTMAEMTREEMLALIAKQGEMIETLAAKANAPKRLTMKVSQKGALSVYGLGRFP